jgi:hypothetical protein
MDDQLYPQGTGREIEQHSGNGVPDHERETRLNTCMTQLAHTMLMLSQELTEAVEARDTLDLQYVASLIEDSRRASALSKQLIALAS